MNPWLLLGIGAAWVGSVGAAGWWCYGAGKDAELATQAREDKAREQTREAAMQGAALAISTIKVQHRTITQEVQRDVVAVPQYRECAHSPQTLESINAALTGQGHGDSATKPSLREDRDAAPTP